MMIFVYSITKVSNYWRTFVKNLDKNATETYNI